MNGLSIRCTSVATTWSYRDGRVTGVSNNGARSFTIGYDRWNESVFASNPYHVTSVDQDSGMLPRLLSCYTYDDANRLVAVGGTSLSLSGNCRGFPLTSLYSYAYDPANNATTFRSATSTTNPTYNAVNQIVTNGPQSFTFDNAGSETSDGTRTFTWDAEDRMAQVTSSSVTTTVRYDGLGRRLELARPGTTERFVWCGSKICSKRNATGALLTSYFDEGEYGGATKKWITMPDHLGNVRDIISVQGSTGTLISSVDYTPYGQTKTKAGTLFPDFMYGGMYEHRTHGGIQYSQTRTYDPGIGRWVSRDPIAEFGNAVLDANPGFEPFGIPTGSFGARTGLVGFGTMGYRAGVRGLATADSTNVYVYTIDDPINRIDPSGLDATRGDYVACYACQAAATAATSACFASAPPTGGTTVPLCLMIAAETRAACAFVCGPIVKDFWDRCKEVPAPSQIPFPPG